MTHAFKHMDIDWSAFETMTLTEMAAALGVGRRTVVRWRARDKVQKTYAPRRGSSRD